MAFMDRVTEGAFFVGSFVQGRFVTGSFGSRLFRQELHVRLIHLALIFNKILKVHRTHILVLHAINCHVITKTSRVLIREFS